MFHLLHTFEPNRILAQLGPATIYWYGFFIALGVLAGLWVVAKLAKRHGLNKNKIFDLAFYTLLFGLIGDRLLHVLSFWRYYVEHPLDIVKVWQGGMAIHGAIIAGTLTLWLLSRKHKISFWLLADIFAPAIILGEAIGRWGNYFNQELFGTPTNLPWGIPIALANRPEQFIDYQYFHPTFLYLSLWNFLVFIGLMVWRYRRQSGVGKEQSNGNSGGKLGLSAQGGYLPRLQAGAPGVKTQLNRGKEGNIFLAYLLFYSLGRGLVEFIRTEETAIVFGMRLGQLLSVWIAAGVVLLWVAKIFLGLTRDRRK